MAGELADEVGQLEARLTSENERLTHEWTGAGKLPPRITSDVVDGLTPQIRAIEASEQLLESAKHELEVHRAGENQFRAEIESAMVSGDKLGLPKDLDAAGDLVAQLRRRQLVEQRIESARRQADELQEQAQELVDDQVVPMVLFSWLLAVVVVGFVALGVWFVMPAAALGRYGGWIAAIGVGGAVVAWLDQAFRRRLGPRPLRRLPPPDRNDRRPDRRCGRRTRKARPRAAAHRWLRRSCDCSTPKNIWRSSNA